MTAYDAAMAVAVVAGMVWGAFRGITWQVASMASLVLGYSVAQPLSGQLAPHFPGEPVVARALAMLAVYVLVSGGVFGVAWLVRATLRRLRFEAFDRHLGMVLGGLEGALLGIVVTLFVVSLAPQTRAPIFASPSGRVVGVVMAAVGPVLPGEVRRVLSPFWAEDGAAAEPDRAARFAPAPEPVFAAAPEPAPEPAVVATRPRAAERARTRPAPRTDAAARPASLSDLIREGESRLGRAIADGAAEGIQRAAGANRDGAAQRR